MQAIMRVELLYGMAGLVGSLMSGHLFLLNTVSLGDGTILLIVSILMHLLSLMHSIFLLQVSVCGISQIVFSPLYRCVFVSARVFRSANNCLTRYLYIWIGITHARFIWFRCDNLI